MKNILKVFVITAGLVLFLNADSFALVDASLYSGYVWKRNSGVDSDFNGLQIGIKGHYNTQLVPLLELGAGLYSQSATIRYGSFMKGRGDKLERTTSGFDVNFLLTTPVIHPYLRGTWAFYDKIKVNHKTEKKSFQTCGLGGGIELGAPFLRVFGEYMYEASKHKFPNRTAGTSMNVNLKELLFGIKINI